MSANMCITALNIILGKQDFLFIKKWSFFSVWLHKNFFLGNSSFPTAFDMGYFHCPAPGESCMMSYISIIGSNATEVPC